MSATVTQQGDIGYFASSSAPRIERYDIANETWLSPIVLSGATQVPSVIHVDGDGLYAAYGKSVYRYQLDGTSPTHLINSQYNVIGIHSDGNILFVNQSNGLYARFLSFNKTSNQLIQSFENYVDSVYGSSISMAANRIIGRSQGISPSDITFVSYGDDGRFTGGGDSPYHGAYPGASTTWVFPDGSKVVDDSGTIYSASSLTRLNSFGGTVKDVAFLGNDVPIVLNGSTLTAFTNSILPSGSVQLDHTPSNIFVNPSHVITFRVDGTAATGYRASLVELSALSPPTPGQPVNPVGLPYTPDKIEPMADGSVLIYSKAHQSLFVWDPQTQRYRQSIPLVDVADYVAYSATTNTAYLAYPSGLIRKIDLSASEPTEIPFATLPQSPLGLSTAGQYLFAVDGSGAWSSHYTFRPDGSLVESVEWNYYSTEYIWNDTNQKMYFFRDDTSPNDLLYEEINANGSAYADEPAGGIRNKIDSPLHVSDGSFQHPIRVAPDGSIVVLASGVIHDAKMLSRLPTALANPIGDAAWVGNELHTIRSFNGGAQIQKWQQPTFTPGSVVQLSGTSPRLLSLPNDQLLAITMGSEGAPVFTVLDRNLGIIDLTPPTLKITPNSTATNSSPITFTFQFNEVVSGFAASDVSITNGVAGTFTAVDGDTYTLQVTPTTEGPVTVSVPENAAQDAAANLSMSASATVISDRTAPSVSITPNGITTKSSPITFTFQFNEIVSGFTANDVSISNGYGGTFIAVDGDTYTLLVTPYSIGQVTVSLADDSAQDAGSNGNTSASATITRDTTAPTLSITPDVTTTNGSPVLFTFQFNEIVSGFTASDISITNGSAGTFTAVDSDTYTLAVTPSLGGTLSVSVAAGAAQDAATNGNVAASVSVTLDLTAPSLSITPNNTTTSESSVLFTFQFSETVTGFAASDVQITNGTAGSFTAVDGDTYRLSVTPGTDGPVNVSVAADAARDKATNGNVAAAASVTSDRTGPSLAITPAGTTVLDNPIVFTFQFSEPVTGFTSSDVQITNGTKGTFSAVDGDTYTLRVTPQSDGPVTVNVSANAARDALLNGNTASSTTITSESQPPRLSSWVRVDESPTNQSVVSSKIVFNESVTGVDPSDFELLVSGIAGASITEVTGSGTIYIITASVGAGDGTLEFHLLDDDSIVDLSGKPFGGTGTGDSYSNGNATYIFDRTAPTVASIARWESGDGETNDNELEFRVTFSEPVAHVDQADFLVNGLTTASVVEIEAAEGSDQTQFWIKVAGGNLSVFNGPVGLNLSPTQNITDLAGNPLPTIEPSIDETYLLNDTLAEYFVRQVKDINTDNASDPQQFTIVGDTLFFTADDGIHGRELWKSDGTAAGTVLVKDISEGEESSEPVSLSNVDGTLLFFVGLATGTTELWKSDGTEAGTVLVKILSVDYFNEELMFAERIAVSNGTLFFSGNDDEHGQELWKSDGTAEGTMLVKDIFPGEDWADTRNLTDVNGTLFFVANDGEHGSELWKSDGTEAGTVLISDQTPGTSSTDFDSEEAFAAVNNTLFFSAKKSGLGYELWKSDGTAAGTGLVKDIQSGSSSSWPSNLTNVNGTLFFSAYTDQHDRELWKSDGTAAGTVRLTDVTDGHERLEPTDLINLDGTLYFLGQGGDYNISLWKSDGTAAGTGPVFTDLPGDSIFFRDLVQADGKLFFTVEEYGLFVSDGTEERTSQVSERFDDISQDDDFSGSTFAVLNDSLFFAGDYENGGELFRTTTLPPLPTEPHLLLDIVPGPDVSHVEQFFAFDGFTYFADNTSGTEQSLWRTDGTAAGTQVVRTFVDPSHYFGFRELEALEDSFYFMANDGIHGYELWKSDGTSANTVLVKDIAAATESFDGSSSPQFLTNVNGTLFFVADDGVNGRELWKSDGTEAGTVLVANIEVTEIYTSSPDQLTAVGDRVFFVANDGVHGEVLWVSDGTAEGTRRVREEWVTPLGWSYSSPSNLTNVDGTLFFTMQSGYSVESMELWKSDGTAEGTVMIKNGFARHAAGYLRNFTSFNGQLLFTGSEGGERELWTSDGTAEGTVAVAQGQFESPVGLTNLGEAVYFRAWTEETGEELWKSDGTSAGTVLVVDALPGSEGSDPNSVAGFDEAIFFATYGQLWKTDGTELQKTNFDREVQFLTSTENGLFFTTVTEAFGNEVWVVNATDTINPTVASIQRDSEGETESVRWKVVFDEPVRGVHLDDFQLATAGFTGAAITEFVGSGTTYFVTAMTGTGTGSIALRLVDNDSIHDSFLNPLSGVGTSGLSDGGLLGEAFVLDSTPPTVVSMSRTLGNRTNAGSVSWTVTFTENVTGVNASDFTLLPSGITGASISSVTGSGNTWTVTASTGSGDGTLGIKLVDDDSITDAAGNPLAGNFTGQVYTLDRTAPSTVSFLRQSPSGSLTSADTLVFRATFSEAVLNVDAADFAANGSTAMVTNVAPVNGSNGKQFDVTVSGGNLSNLEGVVGLDLRATHNITDSVGNALLVAEPPAEQTYTLENTAPTVLSFARQTPSASPTNADTLIFRATFSEQVSDVDATDFAVAGSTAATVTGATLVVGSRGTQYDVTVSDGNLASFNGLVGLNLSGSPTVSDLAGNALAVVEPLTDLAYLVDNVAPAVASIMRQSDDSAPENPSSLLFRVMFSEGVLNIDATDFTVNGRTTATVTGLSGVSGSGGKSFDVTISGGDLANFNGQVGLNLSATQNITDTAGNALPNSEPTTDQMFDVAAYQHLTYAAPENSVLAVRVVNGKLEVKIGGVLQPLASPATVGSLTFTGGLKADTINLAGLSSSLYSHLTRIVISGGAGNDTITGSDFPETITGGLGNDVLKGGGGTDHLIESDYVGFVLTNTRLNRQSFVKEVDALNGFEEAELDGQGLIDASAFTGNVTLTGGTSGDTLIGGSGNDFLGGGNGDDCLMGGAGNDQIYGGNDVDVVVGFGGTSYVLTNTSMTGDGTDVLNRVEVVSVTTSARANSQIDVSAFSGDHAPQYLGWGDRVNTLVGGSGNDVILGSTGRDLINGGAGNDTLDGGAGSDTLSGEDGHDSLLGQTGSGRLDGGNGNDTLSGGNSTDFLDGGLGNDLLTGGDGGDYLYGQAGNDTLDGQAGDDFITGGLGNDSMLGGDGTDRLSESGNANMTLTDISLTGLGNDILSSFELVMLTGGAGKNTLNASAFTLGSVTLDGGAGNDSLIGSPSNDTLWGESGNDTLFGGDGNDKLDGSGGNDVLRGGNGNDTLEGSFGNDGLSGQAGNDSLIGESGKDTLHGGLDNDTLLGGEQDDLLIGGFGVDLINGDLGNDKATGGQGKTGSPRNGNSVADLGDVITAEVIDETFATLFAFE